MAKRWNCARCGTENEEPSLTCSNCRMIRGAVVVPPTKPPSEGWASVASGVPPRPPEAEARQPDPDAPTPAAPMGATASYWAQAPAGPPPLWRRLIRWVIPAVFVLAVIAGVILNASRSSTGEISRAGNMHWSELRIGDCFDIKDPEAESVNDVTARPCREEHEYEVFLIPTMPAGTYPSEDAFFEFVADKCVPAFATYVGKDYESSALDIFWLFPDTEGWNADDRALLCSVYHPRIHRLTSSLKGSNR